MRHVALTTVLLATQSSAQTIAQVPTVSIGNPQSLAGVISFAPPAPALKPYGGSKILWRADLGLPAGVAVESAPMNGYAPIIFTLRDGRCFKLDFNGAGMTLEKVDVAPVDCSTDGPPAGAPPPPPPPSPPRAGLVYVGRAWNLIAWTDTSSGESMLVPEQDGSARPVLTTSMRVIAVGGMASIDTPMTEVSLVGYVRGKLVASTVMLILP